MPRESPESIHQIHSSVVSDLEENNNCNLDENIVCATIPLDGDKLSYVKLRFSPSIRRRALIDTGACANALPESMLRDIENDNQAENIKFQSPEYTKVKMASGQVQRVNQQAEITFQIGNHVFTDTFLVPPTMNMCHIG